MNAVREDPQRKGLLYAGTEIGVFVSFDDGDNWQSLQVNLPVTSVRDLTIHGDDLVAATHGRSFWILDDIAPLRQMRKEMMTPGFEFLFKPADGNSLAMEPQHGYAAAAGRTGGTEPARRRDHRLLDSIQ